MDTETEEKKSQTRGGRAAAARSGRGARLEHHLRLRDDAEQASLLGRHARLPDYRALAAMNRSAFAEYLVSGGRRGDEVGFRLGDPRGSDGMEYRRDLSEGRSGQDAQALRLVE
jgi:hypothetical protein